MDLVGADLHPERGVGGGSSGGGFTRGLDGCLCGTEGGALEEGRRLNDFQGDLGFDGRAVSILITRRGSNLVGISDIFPPGDVHDFSV